MYYGQGFSADLFWLWKRQDNRSYWPGDQSSQPGEKCFCDPVFKRKKEDEISFLARLEPEIKLFRFEKTEESFQNLTEDEQAEEIQHLKNGMNFAKKVVVTEECDVLVLDEVLGLMDYGIVTAEDLRSLIGMSREGMRLILPVPEAVKRSGMWWTKQWSWFREKQRLTTEFKNGIVKADRVFRRGCVFQEYIVRCVQAQEKIIEREGRRKVQYL